MSVLSNEKIIYEPASSDGIKPVSTVFCPSCEQGNITDEPPQLPASGENYKPDMPPEADVEDDGINSLSEPTPTSEYSEPS
jgi:hypothetical protein